MKRVTSSQPFTDKSWITYQLIAILMVAVIFLLTYRLSSWPSVWWDEGWTLDAARNWIEHGHLGHYLDGEAVPPRIPVRFPILVPVALSMKLLGSGIWQGRLPGVIFTFITICLTAYLTGRMYNRRAGLLSLFTTLIIIPFVYHPIVMGRQILAEMPMMFYLIAGYSLLWLALTRSPIWGIGAAMSFGIGLHAKLQVPPFWLLSMALAVWMAVSLRQRRSLYSLVGISSGSILIAGLIYLVQNKIMPGSFDDPALLKLLINSVIIVLDGKIRLIALIIVVLYALPQFLSLIWAGKRSLPDLWMRRQSEQSSINPIDASKKILRVGIWGICASWFLWYLLLGLSWERYLFPPIYFGSIFLAAYLDELTTGVNLRMIMQRATSFLFHRGFNRKNFESLVLIVILGITLGMVVSSVNGAFGSPDTNPVITSIYLHENIPPASLVETFESELLFLTPEVDFHFPSDLLSMQLNRKSSIDPQFPADYDPMEYKPDFLVIGPMGRMWGLYEEALSTGLFELISTIGGYQIYRIAENSPIN